ncbi:MAG: hypothetical protein ACQR33_04265 [Candidatus Saccharibacteria bacterium]
MQASKLDPELTFRQRQRVRFWRITHRISALWDAMIALLVGVCVVFLTHIKYMQSRHWTPVTETPATIFGVVIFSLICCVATTFYTWMWARRHRGDSAFLLAVSVGVLCGVLDGYALLGLS